MPQMAPIWWTTLFLTFILTFMLFMMIMYFFNIYTLKTESNLVNKKTTNIYWKW